MGRLCERPGCSENASVAYGMRAEDLVFWLDVIRPSEEIAGGVLCQRHADSMIVPRNWTLDDLRDPELHLFRPPTIKRAAATRARRAGHRDETAEQLQLGVLPSPDSDTDIHVDSIESVGNERPTIETPQPEVPESTPSTVAQSVTDVVVPDEDVRPVPTGDDDESAVAAESAPTADNDEAPASPWVPSFDSGDDLDGLLSASSPLLARAFRGDDRPS